MPYFDEASLRRLAEGFGAVPDKAQRLTEALLAREYVSESAKEYAHHGVCRRLSILARCIEQIYRRLPPERDEVPPREALLDTTIGIQAFVFNAYGVLDNLAFVWVKEKHVTKPNGQPLPNGRVGLTADKGEVRQSFSPEMQAYLRERDAWLAYLEGFRHSLGHRIPLYIPPYIIAPAQVNLYQDLEDECGSFRAPRLSGARSSGGRTKSTDALPALDEALLHRSHPTCALPPAGVGRLRDGGGDMPEGPSGVRSMKGAIHRPPSVQKSRIPLANFSVDISGT